MSFFFFFFEKKYTRYVLLYSIRCGQPGVRQLHSVAAQTDLELTAQRSLSQNHRNALVLGYMGLQFSILNIVFLINIRRNMTSELFKLPRK